MLSDIKSGVILLSNGYLNEYTCRYTFKQLKQFDYKDETLVTRSRTMFLKVSSKLFQQSKKQTFCMFVRIYDIN